MFTAVAQALKPLEVKSNKKPTKGGHHGKNFYPLR
jgi:hypothetical protein